MATRQAFEPLHVAQQFAESTLTLWVASPGLFVHRVEGLLDAAPTQKIIDTLTPYLEAGVGAISFNDWYALTGYETVAREMLTHWVLKYRKVFRRVHILQKSKLVAMGVSVANVMVGGILEPHSTRIAWEQALVSAAAGLGLDRFAFLREYRRKWGEPAGER